MCVSAVSVHSMFLYLSKWNWSVSNEIYMNRWHNDERTKVRVRASAHAQTQRMNVRERLEYALLALLYEQLTQ